MSSPSQSDSERLELLAQRAQRDVIAVIDAVALHGELDFERLTTLRDALMLRDPDHGENA
jgi:hypothetical protein